MNTCSTGRPGSGRADQAIGKFDVVKKGFVALAIVLVGTRPSWRRSARRPHRLRTARCPIRIAARNFSRDELGLVALSSAGANVLGGPLRTIASPSTSCAPSTSRLGSGADLRVGSARCIRPFVLGEGVYSSGHDKTE